MAEPIERIIIRAQQDFDLVGGLNPIQIEIEDDRKNKYLKKIQKCYLQNNNSWTFISCNSYK